ncbi:CDP-glycerol glycerophosphotransferase family protein [Pseudoalteromonas sp. MMG010]|uniref:CDP-glycerol glycerophosphotransferase family protein n=1 Tax=Pseudoalteromonas sp. MMG010 TaxID=2822685 RepID=UPI001B3A103E|nr:CDP-glycerol glycerophosphotransferase family protein [Pseudoalteromonas sp. MMG010]MBQ4832692.1 CDP-glycerol glycerophosphotransferase family protein [Pseudoalteromonas sp. MMG010]
MKVIFDTQSLYYLPQYIPVFKELSKEGIKSKFVFYKNPHSPLIQNVINHYNLDHIWVDKESEAISFYEKEKADWVFFANSFPYLERLHKVSKSAQLGHGIGPKASYYTKSSKSMTVRFVEGEYRCSRLKTMYPEDVFIDVGFCKLDPIFNNEQIDGALNLTHFSKEKKTILYAPTFYPSSLELFPKNWPEHFANYNILIKPHYFSISKEKYQKHVELLKAWAEYPNVYLASVEDYSLVPFLAEADLLISDASSALFEFALLNKPVIWCDFLKLRWSYRGIFSYRFKKRMDKDYGEYADLAVHAKKYKNLKNLVEQQLAEPNHLADKRLSLSKKLAGTLDGKASQRIVEYLKNNSI